VCGYQVTASQVSTLEETTGLYLSVGKAYIKTEKGDITGTLEKQRESLLKTQQDLSDRKIYLERRIQSNTANIKELTGTA
jgi:chaperonin cofactor prefoldin